jgi:hypothetical protein
MTETILELGQKSLGGGEGYKENLGGGGGNQKISWNFAADLWKSGGLVKNFPKNAIFWPNFPIFGPNVF